MPTKVLPTLSFCVCLNSLPFVQSTGFHFDIFENMLCSCLMNSDAMINVNYICFLSSSVPFLRKKSFSTCQTSSEAEGETKKKNIVDSFFQVLHGTISSRRIA